MCPGCGGCYSVIVICAPLLSDGNVSQKDALTNTYKSCYTTSPFFPFGAAACQSFLGPSKDAESMANTSTVIAESQSNFFFPAAVT